jgi:hypothetical protein
MGNRVNFGIVDIYEELVFQHYCQDDVFYILKHKPLMCSDKPFEVSWEKETKYYTAEEVKNYFAKNHWILVEYVTEPVILSEVDQENLERVLTVMECLIDTVASTTDLENVYNANDESVSWSEVWKTYRALKTIVGVE